MFDDTVVSVPAVAATTAAASTASTTPAAASVAAAAAAGSLFPWTRFIYSQSPSVKLSAIQLSNGFVSILITHLYETKPLRAAGVPICDYVCRRYFANLAEQIGQIILCRLIRQISNIDSLRHVSP
jgi:hypothetical protein